MVVACGLAKTMSTKTLQAKPGILTSILTNVCREFPVVSSVYMRLLTRDHHGGPRLSPPTRLG